MIEQLSIKVFPGLSSSSMRCRLDKELVLWMLMRSLDSEGRGWVLKNNFQKALLDRGLFSEKTLERQMKDGRDVFWSEETWTNKDGKVDKVLRYKGLLQVAQELRCPNLGVPVCVSGKEIGSTLHQRHALLYAIASAAPEGQRTNPRSRGFLEAHLGKEQTTQRRYEATVGVRVVPNFWRDYIDPLRPSVGQLPSSRYHRFKILKVGQGRKYRLSKGLDTEARLNSRLYFSTKEELIQHQGATNTSLACVYLLQNSLRNSPTRHARLFWETIYPGDFPEHTVHPQNRRGYTEV
jgi:hypothetical protein